MSEHVANLTSDILPGILCERDQWVCWVSKTRGGKQTKLPVIPDTGSFASATDPETWSDVETALEYAHTDAADGIGFVFTESDPLVGIDLDDVLDPETGAVDDDAQDIIDRLDSYTEISPSGTGYHILLEGELPDGRNRRGQIECYDNARFFTVTGDHVSGTPTHIARRQDALVAIHGEYLTQADPATRNTTATSTLANRSHSQSNPGLEDAALLETASNAKNGPKFKRLWNGSTGGYDSNSEADMALCFLLAFWSGGDAAQIDRLFRQSDLYREKWDDIHYADGSTYGEKTIERAITGTSDFYEPSTGDEDASAPESNSAGDRRQSETSESAYLAEKNQVLRARVTELVTTLEQKNERIKALEADVARLTGEFTEDAEETDSS
ncbi:phage NrS-1 polymerase family protein [Halobaculum limi]|uniref:phage NrS-1 polymerase family protein n=1 Tax=Halobaculum limi TaxID=3031916 RepID=UPI002404EC26|nr:hypothetical protein [Halobaculum sp. YSMS11]